MNIEINKIELKEFFEKILQIETLKNPLLGIIVQMSSYGYESVSESQYKVMENYIENYMKTYVCTGLTPCFSDRGLSH